MQRECIQGDGIYGKQKHTTEVVQLLPPDNPYEYQTGIR